MIKEILHKNITEVMEALQLSHEKDFIVEIPNNTEFGDYSRNRCLGTGKREQDGSQSVSREADKRT